ncbi:DUF2976 domain-containing protein [Vibrio barjaei]|uniref:DUF2976 domain-containing protein n=1 Tax=Vibrio barjaei TaxID=1676683 RepID=UPI002283848D|nr:DUF2976 domain-containing protein [Vibrio barjaei]MCY9874545.1 DUF2976 domain-containing protein [Vibrio barjaei]
MSLTKKLSQIKASVFTAIATMFAPLSANAALPLQSVTVTGGDYLGAFKSIFINSYGIASMVIAGFVFFVIGVACIHAFWQYQQGKKELSDVGVVAAVGGVILMIVVVLLKQGETVVV